MERVDFASEDLRERITRISQSDDPRIASLATENLRRDLEAIAGPRDPKIFRPGSRTAICSATTFSSRPAKKSRGVLALLDFESAFEGALIFDVMVTMLGVVRR